jgi:hypothetical protein
LKFVGIVMGLICTAAAQNVHGPKPAEKAALDRKATAEMNLASVDKGMAERRDYIAQQTKELQADNRELTKYGKKSVDDQWKGKIESLKRSIAEREASIQKAQATKNELFYKRVEYDHELTKAREILVSLQMAKVREGLESKGASKPTPKPTP